MSALTIAQVSNLSYPDFVGLINQWNVLPGAYTTLNEWATFSRMNEKSRLLQIACTTGFQSRELALMTGCSAVGVDRSQSAIEMAKYNQRRYAPNATLSYFCGDALEFSSNEPFTHIAIGAGLGFFAEPERMLARCESLLVDGGYLLASPFYLAEPLTDKLIARARRVFGITPTTDTYQEMISKYSRYEILYENRRAIEQESEAELTRYCASTVRRAQSILGSVEEGVERVMHERLLEIRRTSNALRPLQRFAVLVLRYRRSVFPERFVELF